MTRVCLCLSLFLLALPAHADISGRVVGVSDGDTLTVLDVDQVQHKVRLAGIDAPEKKQAFGQKSKEALSDCAYGQRVEVQGSKLDRYGRLIGKVLAQQQDCNLRQIRLGMAWLGTIKSTRKNRSKRIGSPMHERKN